MNSFIINVTHPSGKSYLPLIVHPDTYLNDLIYYCWSVGYLPQGNFSFSLYWKGHVLSLNKPIWELGLPNNTILVTTIHKTAASHSSIQFGGRGQNMIYRKELYKDLQIQNPTPKPQTKKGILGKLIQLFSN